MQEPTQKEKRISKPVHQPFMELWDSIEDEVIQPHKKKRKKYQKALTKPPLDKDRPRWWNMSLLLYLVLKNAGLDNPLPRNILIPEAMKLHDKMVQERELPKLYHGKTPDNTFSMILTENKDKLFKRVQKQDSKLQHFSLAFEPGNFQDALLKYNEWMDLLIKHDWPILFSNKRDVNDAPMDKGIIQSFDSSVPVPIPESVEPSNEVDPLHLLGQGQVQLHVQDQVLLEQTQTHDQEQTQSEEEQDIPKSLFDIVEIKESTIPGAGRGLFAKRDIPKYTFIGFYFGVPMTEDEFDSLKEHVGQASHYSHKYRKTVLDATNEQGQPYIDDPELYCPFHFMNEDLQKANVQFVEGYIVNQVLCMTSKNVYNGDELFVYYGKDVNRSHW